MQFSFKKIFGFFSLFLLASARGLAVQSAQICQVGGTAGADFTCGNLPQAFQPCSDFQLVGGQSTAATLRWMLAENHSNRAQTAECIEALTEDVGEHVIYLDAQPAGKEVRCKDHGIKEKPGRTCAGLDDLSAIDELNNAVLDTRVQNHILDYQNYYQQHKLSDKEFDKLLSGFMQYSRQQAQNKDTHLDIKGMNKAYHWMMQERKQGYSYAAIFSERAQVRLDSLKSPFHNMKKANLKRNKSVIKTFRDNSGIFSIGVLGKSHLVRDQVMTDGNVQDIGASEYIRGELEKDAADRNYYAILSQ